MKKRAWKTRIKKACIAAETYKPYFDFAIDELAGILERRDAAAAEYAEDPKPLIEYTNKNDSTNLVKNPLLVLIDDMTRSALAYWRDLGLTPAGLRKINERTFKEGETKTSNSLIDRLKALQEARGAENGRAEGN
jgi:hypothetical protein